MAKGLIAISDVPSLSGLEVESVDLNTEYWSPEEKGETRRLIFMGVHVRKAPDHDNPEVMVDLPCAVFVEPADDGAHKTVMNASARLVAAFENSELEKGTPVQIVYRGKKRNRTNANLSDDWAIQTLKLKGKE